MFNEEDLVLVIGELYMRNRLLQQQLAEIEGVAIEAQEEIASLKEKLDEMGRAEK